MSHRFVLGIADPVVTAQAIALMREDPDLEVVDSVVDAGSVLGALGLHSDVDVIVLHEELGPLPVMDLARELGVRYPHLGVVLIVRERTGDVLRAALQAGVRDVLSLPLTFEELQGGLHNAAAWSQAVKERIGVEAPDNAGPASGVMIAMAGAKGGVGTTTLAVRLALEAARSNADRSVCLVDFDLQSGDVGILLDLSHRHDITDLLEVVDDIAPRQIEEAVYRHSTGMRVLLAPKEGERAEEVGAHAARQILGAIKFRYDFVIVDMGAVVTEGSAVAAEMADEVLVVTTPDVPSLRAANRLMALWERLSVRKPESVRIVVNRVNKQLEVQPDLIRRVVNAPLVKTVMPAAFKDLEPAVNTGVPDRLNDGSLQGAFVKLGQEVGVIPRGRGRRKLALRSSSGESGQLAVETMGMTLLILVLALTLWQMVIAGYTYVLAGHAAREGARELAVGNDYEAAALADLPGWFKDAADVSKGTDWVEVDIAMPMLVPGVDSPVHIAVKAGTIVESAGVAASRNVP